MFHGLVTVLFLFNRCSLMVTLWWSCIQPFDPGKLQPSGAEGILPISVRVGELHPDESHVRHFQPQRPSISGRPCWNQSSADVLKSEGWRVWVHVTTSSFRVKIRRQAMLLCGYEIYLYMLQVKCHDTLGWQFIDDIPQAPWVELKQVW